MRKVWQALITGSLVALGAGTGLAESAGFDRSRVTVRQVWADFRTNTLGQPSLDGQFLSFTDWETGDLAVRNLSTGENRRLTNNGPDSREYAYFSTMSPDGGQVAYAWFNEEKFYELRVVSTEDPKPPLLLPGFQQPGAARSEISAGASAPEVLVAEVIDAFREHFEVTLEDAVTAREDMQFKVPRELLPEAG